MSSPNEPDVAVTSDWSLFANSIGFLAASKVPSSLFQLSMRNLLAIGSLSVIIELSASTRMFH